MSGLDEGPFRKLQMVPYSDWPTQVTLFDEQPTIPWYNNVSNPTADTQFNLAALNQGSELIMARQQEYAEREYQRTKKRPIDIGANLFGL